MRIGIDVGGTKIEGIAIGAGGEEVRRVRVPTPRHDYGGTISTIASIVATLERDLQQTGTVGLGIPGAASPATGLIKNANSTWLNGKPFQHDLEAALARPVRLANDANCFALSEAVDGAAAGANVVFGVILGTGCGGGIVVDRRVLTGPNAIAGEWGHNPLPWPRDEELPGPSCYCGRTGCIETFLSGPAFAADYAASGGEPVDAAEVARRAERGEHLASAALERYEERLARALTSVINILDPDVVVLGGGLSNISSLYDSLPRRLRPFGNDVLCTRIVPARHGDSSGVRGAAWLWELGTGNREQGTGIRD